MSYTWINDTIHGATQSSTDETWMSELVTMCYNIGLCVIDEYWRCSPSLSINSTSSQQETRCALLSVTASPSDWRFRIHTLRVASSASLGAILYTRGLRGCEEIGRRLEVAPDQIFPCSDPPGRLLLASTGAGHLLTTSACQWHTYRETLGTLTQFQHSTAVEAAELLQIK